MTDQGDARRVAGWKKDPSGRHFGRYWDGEAWTEHVISAEKVRSVDPMPPRPEPSLFPDSPPPPPPPPAQPTAPSPAASGPAQPVIRGPVPTAPGWTPSPAAGPPPQRPAGSAPDPIPTAVIPARASVPKHQLWRTFRGWPLWVQAVLILVGLIILGGAVTPRDDDKKTVSASQATTTRETTSHVQVIPPSSTPPPTPPPTPATTATTAPAKVSRDAQLAAFTQAFEKTRVGLADAIKKDNPVSVTSVDRLEFDPSGPTVILNVTSGYSTDKFLRDSAWAVTKDMQPLWDAKTLASVQDVIPRFRLTVGVVKYECPHDFMVKLAALRASREDWEATCKVA